MGKKRSTTKATEVLEDLHALLTDKISSFHHAIKACEARQDPSIAIMVSHRHAFIFYRRLVYEALQAIKNCKGE